VNSRLRKILIITAGTFAPPLALLSVMAILRNSAVHACTLELRLDGGGTRCDLGFPSNSLLITMILIGLVGALVAWRIARRISDKSA
jgi:hypothetical protein